MKNELLTYNETPKKNNYNKKQIKLILILVTITIALLLILFYIFIYNSPSNKLHRYLKDNNFECNTEICTKEIDGTTYNINYKNGNLNTDNINYTFILSNLNHKINLKKENKTCIYEKESFSKYNLIDENFTYSIECKEYVSSVNEIITNYNNIIDESRVDVNSLEN